MSSSRTVWYTYRRAHLTARLDYRYGRVEDLVVESQQRRQHLEVMAQPTDTSRDAERLVIDGYRQMAPAEQLARVEALNRALVALATVRLRSQYGADLSSEELDLRLAALRLDADVTRRFFDCDPSIRGL